MGLVVSLIVSLVGIVIAIALTIDYLIMIRKEKK